MPDTIPPEARALPAETIAAMQTKYLTLHEFVKAAKHRLDANIWDYLIGATETETTMRRNRLALDALAFRPRVLRDVSVIDSTASLLRPLDPPAGDAGPGRRARIVRRRRQWRGDGGAGRRPSACPSWSVR